MAFILTFIVILPLIVIIIALPLTVIRMIVRRRRFKKAGIPDPHPWLGWGKAPK